MEAALFCPDVPPELSAGGGASKFHSVQFPDDVCDEGCQEQVLERQIEEEQRVTDDTRYHNIIYIYHISNIYLFF